jgi:hypothetical protein
LLHRNSCGKKIDIDHKHIKWEGLARTRLEPEWYWQYWGWGSNCRASRGKQEIAEAKIWWGSDEEGGARAGHFPPCIHVVRHSKRSAIETQRSKRDGMLCPP